jgi:type I restriction enzyme R subunit
MRRALPNAGFIGFTGTPLIKPARKRSTREVFGDYVSGLRLRPLDRRRRDGAAVLRERASPELQLDQPRN